MATWRDYFTPQYTWAEFRALPVVMVAETVFYEQAKAKAIETYRKNHA